MTIEESAAQDICWDCYEPSPEGVQCFDCVQKDADLDGKLHGPWQETSEGCYGGSQIRPAHQCGWCNHYDGHCMARYGMCCQCN